MRLTKKNRKMKFTKEEAFEKLKGLLTNNGRKSLRMSEKSLGGQIETLMPLIADEEMDLDAFVEKVRPSLEIMNSNAEKDKSDFIRDWKKEHPEPEPDKDKARKDENPEMVALMERLTALEKQNADAERERNIAGKRGELKAKLREKGIEDAEWTDMALSEITLSEDSDVDAKAESLLKLYNRQNAATPKGWSPHSASGTSEDSAKLFEKVRALKAQRDEAQKAVL